MIATINYEYYLAVAKDARQTRDALIRAAEHLFARQGVDGALTRDIVREAGQGNGSAVQYHFGSRRGLLLAIAAKHIARMEPDRQDHLGRLSETPASELGPVVAAIVAPTAEELHSPDGRDFLRIIAQLAGYAGFRAGGMPAPLAGTALERQLRLLAEHCRASLPETIAHERIANVVGLLTASLADRARLLDAGEPPALPHEGFVDNLVLMIVGAIEAPVPATAGVR